MLYAGLDLSRQRLDVHVLDEEGRTVDVTAPFTQTRTPYVPSPIGSCAKAGRSARS
jgi:hypothetical protein